MIRCLFQILLIQTCLLGSSLSRTLEELQVAYEVKVLKLRRNHEESLDGLGKGYFRALASAQKKLQDAGRLDDVLTVKEEQKKVETGEWPLPKLDESAPMDLRRLRKVYEKARVRAELEHAEALVETSDKMKELLAVQMKSLTKAGEIEQAREAKSGIEKLDADADLAKARDLMARVRLNREAPVAMRIRRSGDDLEVLVRYDKQGEVSLDSPVENVIELTGERKEKGETAATVLGEFIGADGYEVDSYISFESDMEKLTPPMRGISFDLEADVEIEGRESLRILMPEKAPNPRVEWPDVLASKASASLIKIDFQYFIPSDNEKLKGFSFHWGLAAPIENQVMDTTGRWVTESLEAESMNEYEILRFYVQNMSGSRKTFNGGNESIYLDDLKVTFLKFAAHRVATYQDDKVSGEVVTDPAAQKAVALAGKLLQSPNN